MASPAATSVFSRPIYSMRTVESDVATDSSRMMTQSMLCVIDESTSRISACPLPESHSGAREQKGRDDQDRDEHEKTRCHPSSAHKPRSEPQICDAHAAPVAKNRRNEPCYSIL